VYGNLDCVENKKQRRAFAVISKEGRTFERGNGFVEREHHIPQKPLVATPIQKKKKRPLTRGKKRANFNKGDVGKELFRSFLGKRKTRRKRKREQTTPRRPGKRGFGNPEKGGKGQFRR